MTKRFWGAAMVLCGVCAGVAVILPAGGLLLLFAVVIGGGLFLAPKPALACLGFFLAAQGLLVAALGGGTSPLGVAVQRFDEAIAVAGLCRVVVLVAWGGEWDRVRRPVQWLAAFVACGLVSSLIHRVPVVVTAMGGFLALKFGILFLLALTVRWNAADARRLVRWLLVAGPLLLALGLLRLVIPASWENALSSPQLYGASGFARGGFISLQGPFVHPGVFGWAMALTGCYAFASVLSGRRRAGVISLAASFAGVLGSLRRKALAGLVLAMLTSIRGMRLRRRVGVIMAVVLLLSVTWFAGRGRIKAAVADALTNYADPYAPTTARGLLYVTGWQLATENVPLGEGFGRFGGYASRLFYSPVYDRYGLSQVAGLSRDAPDYIEDTYWPHILGETGFLGALALGAFLVWIWLRLSRGLGDVRDPAIRVLVLGASAALIEAVIESIASPVFEASLPAFMVAVPLGMSLVLVKRDRGETAPPRGER